MATQMFIILRSSIERFIIFIFFLPASNCIPYVGRGSLVLRNSAPRSPPYFSRHCVWSGQSLGFVLEIFKNNKSFLRERIEPTTVSALWLCATTAVSTYNYLNIFTDNQFLGRVSEISLPT